MRFSVKIRFREKVPSVYLFVVVCLFIVVVVVCLFDVAEMQLPQKFPPHLSLTWSAAFDQEPIHQNNKNKIKLNKFFPKKYF